MGVLGSGAVTTELYAQQGDWRDRAREIQRSIDERLADVNPLYETYRRYMREERSELVRVSGPVLASVVETEPNDSVSVAETVSIGDTVAGTISSDDDIDYFVVDVPDGTVLDLDIDAASMGSPLNSIMALFAPESTNDNLLILALSDDAQGPDSHIIYFVDQGGMYFIGVAGLNGGSNHDYALKITTRTLTEQEPNDQPNTSEFLQFGDTALGFVGTVGDKDYYAIDAFEGTLLDIDIDAAAVGSLLDPFLTLFDADEVTILAQDDNADQIDARIQFYVPSSGRYYVEVKPAVGSGDPSFFYLLHLDSLETGPGDPTVVESQAVIGPQAMAVGPDGTLFVADLAQAEVVKIAPDGTSSILETSLDVNLDVAVDGFGDVLVSGFTFGEPPVVIRIEDDGITVFSDAITGTGPLAVAANGDVWALDLNEKRLYRHDPFGEVVDRIDVGEIGFGFDIAFSPDGVLHITDDSTRVVALEGSSLVEVVSGGGPRIEGIAFDRDGYLYVSEGLTGRIELYDPSYQLVESPFARSHLGGPLSLAFGRTATGTPTKKLFIGNGGFRVNAPFRESVLSANETGIRAPGHVVGADFFTITADFDSIVVGRPYTATLEAGVSGVIWSVHEGVLPPGLELNSNTGEISGIPEASGSFNLTLRGDTDARLGFFTTRLQVLNPVLQLIDVVDALFGVEGTVNVDEIRFLDLQGNSNDVLDVGDFRAYLELIQQGCGGNPCTVSRPPLNN